MDDVASNIRQALVIGVRAVTAPLITLRALHGVAYCCGEVGGLAAISQTWTPAR